MRMNSKTGFALVLIAFGVLLILNKFGMGLGWFMSYLIPLAMIGLGYLGIKNGSKFFGWLIFIIGMIALLGKFAGLIGFLVAAGFIVYGISLLRRDKNAY
jgi:lia operon protein LiaI